MVISLFLSEVMYKEKIPVIYIMTNVTYKVLYIGVTSDLIKRVYEHKSSLDKKSFTGQYNCNILVYYEVFDTMEQAILREKQLKARNRVAKEKLIIMMNPTWKDLYEDIC